MSQSEPIVIIAYTLTLLLVGLHTGGLRLGRERYDTR